MERHRERHTHAAEERRAPLRAAARRSPIQTIDGGEEEERQALHVVAVGEGSPSWRSPAARARRARRRGSRRAGRGADGATPSIPRARRGGRGCRRNATKGRGPQHQVKWGGQVRDDDRAGDVGDLGHVARPERRAEREGVRHRSAIDAFGVVLVDAREIGADPQDERDQQQDDERPAGMARGVRGGRSRARDRSYFRRAYNTDPPG